MIDLHVHTQYSYGDGHDTPAAVVRLAKRKGLRAIAITDHDTVEGVEEAVLEGTREGVEVIPGAEFSSRHNDKSFHILGLFIDWRDKALRDHFIYKNRIRNNENLMWIGALTRAGVEFQDNELDSLSRVGINSLSNLVSRAKRRCGLSENELRAITGGITYLKSRMPSSADVIRLIIGAGGAPVLAHPGRYKIPAEELAQSVRELRRVGLAGLETYYSSYTPETEAFCVNLARDCALVCSGGSDFHGYEKNDGIEIGAGYGSLRIPYSVLDELRNCRIPSRIDQC